MKEIPLTQGKVALVDDADFEAVSKFKWHAAKRRSRFYAARKIHKPDGEWTIQYLHQFLMPGVPQIDHQYGDGLDNRRKNIRPATNQQNRHGVNRKKVGAGSTFRGVSRDKQRGSWKAKIKACGKTLFLGRFSVESDAARAYDTAAKKYFGEFASPNFN